MKLRAPWILLALASCGDPPSGRQETPTTWFVDATERSGLAFVHDQGATDERHLPETMGAGAALFDWDRDGDLDLYFVQGGPFPPSPAVSGVHRNELWRNDGAGNFEDASSEIGDAAHAGYGMGVCVGDVNGDGFDDLYVTNFGPDALLLGSETGAFRDATTEAGLGDSRWTTGCTFFDADADGDLDLYVTGYVEIDVANPTWCGLKEEGLRSYCHPDHYPGLADRLWINDGTGRFIDKTSESGLLETTGKGLGAIAVDLDGNGYRDLYVANDSTENRLWLNRGDGFEDGTLLSGTGVNANGLSEAGMGIAVGDVNGDGRLDLFVTNFDNESNTLYRNEGDGFFEDATVVSGLEAPSRLPVGFGTVLADLDHDGVLDLAVANGHIIHNIDRYNDGKSHAQRLQLFRGDGEGRFEELREACGVCDERFVGRGLYAGDLDGDTDLDLVLTVCGGRARIFENTAAAARSGIVVHGLPRDSLVTARWIDGTSTTTVSTPQVSYFGQSDGRPHFGRPLSELVSLVHASPTGERSERTFEPRSAPADSRAWLRLDEE